MSLITQPHESESTNICELHQKELVFVCRYPKCQGGYYAFGCDDCQAQLGLHRHAHMPKYRQSLGEFLKEIDDFFSEDPTILELIDQTKGILNSFRKDNKFFKENYSKVIDTLRIRSINRLPKEGSQEIEVLLNLKEKRLSKVKQDHLARLELTKQALLKKDKTVTEKKIHSLRQIIIKINRKFRINFERSNSDLIDIIKLSSELKDLQTEDTLPQRSKSPSRSVMQLKPRQLIKSAGNVKHIIKIFEENTSPLSITSIELEVDFDHNLQLKMDSYKSLLSVFLNDCFNIKSMSLTITDAFITKHKIALLKDFLMEMALRGNLKQFTLLNREAISGVNMPAIHTELSEGVPLGFKLRVDYFYS